MRAAEFTDGFFVTMAAGFLGFGAYPVCLAAGPCATTPAAAVRAFEGGAVAGEAASDGYRVTRIHRDTVLGTRWASVERCGHPDWPTVAVPASGAAAGGDVDAGRTTAVAIDSVGRGPRLVRAGETVRLWRQDTNVRLEMAAVSEEGGSAGDRIRMRVTTRQEYGDSVRYVYGLVRGSADVEMEQ